MLTEFEVRRELEAILRADASPMKKARMLLKLDRALKAQTRILIHAHAASAQRHDSDTAVRLERLSRRLNMLHDDVRLEAQRAMRPENPVMILS
jgi:imidazolonepropionase-like amidohydrolase